MAFQRIDLTKRPDDVGKPEENTPQVVVEPEPPKVYRGKLVVLEEELPENMIGRRVPQTARVVVDDEYDIEAAIGDMRTKNSFQGKYFKKQEHKSQAIEIKVDKIKARKEEKLRKLEEAKKEEEKPAEKVKKSTKKTKGG